MSRRGGGYVDNAMNRSLGRVGMPYGSCVQSSSHQASSFSSSAAATSGATPQKVYADNDYNRRIGRAGKEFGSHVVSKIPASSSSASASSTTSSIDTSSVSQKTYVDNSLNRELGRVGKPHGSHVQHSDGSVTIPEATSSTYVDNSLNRRLDRVGKPHGSHVQHSDGSVTTTDKTPSPKLYADNAMNRKLGRAGQPKGSHVVHRDPSQATTYANNPYNRKKDRVGKEIVRHHHGKMKPHDMERRLIEENDSEEIEDMLQELDLRDDDYLTVRNAQYSLQHSKVKETWGREGIELATDLSKLPEFAEKSIPLVEIEMHAKIGEGGFGVVYAGKWKGTPIAFKKLLYQEMTNKKTKEFVNEVGIFSKLSHKNIVKMLGVVTEKDSIGIVMEYLPTTLFQALFIDEVEFSSYEKKKLVSEVISALEYLHDAGITHCDIKCQNVLLDASNVAKICDFGLSMVKNSSASTSYVMVSQGTPRYSAPEVLRGEILQRSQLMMTDIYSLSLLIYQVLVEEEPFDTLSILQLQENVGRGYLRPSLDETNVREPVKKLLAKGWAKEPANRPDIHKFAEEWEKIVVILV